MLIHSYTGSTYSDFVVEEVASFWFLPCRPISDFS